MIKYFYSLIITLFILFFSDALIGMLSGIKNLYFGELRNIALAYFSGLVILCVLLHLIERRIFKVSILIFLIALSVLSRIWWVQNFDSYQVSDFGQYYNCGLVISGQVSSDYCDITRFAGAFWNRAYLYTAPILFLAGDGLAAIEYGNIAIFFLTLSFFSLILVQIFSLNVAILATYLFSAYPDSFYAMTMASHDNPGIMGLIFSFFVFIGMQRVLDNENSLSFKCKRLFFYETLLGLILIQLKYQREYHIPLLIVIGIYVFYLFSKNLKRPEQNGSKCASSVLTLTAFLVPLIILSAFDNFSSNPFIRDTTRPNSHITLLSSMDITGVQRFGQTAFWSQIQLPVVIEKGSEYFVEKKVLHELTHEPLDTLSFFQRKNLFLSSGKGNYEFSRYSNGGGSIADKFVKNTNSKLKQEQRSLITAYIVTLFVLVIVRILFLPFMPFKGEEYIILSFSIVLFLTVLLIGWGQPRYFIFLAFPFSYMAAQVLNVGICKEARDKLTQVNWKNFAIQIFTTLGILIFAGFAFLSLARYIQKNGYALEDLRNSSRISSFKEVSNNLEGSFKFVGDIKSTYKSVELNSSEHRHFKVGDAIGMRYAKKIDNEVKLIEFFLRAVQNYKMIENEKFAGEFSVFIYINNELIENFDLSNINSEFISTELKGDSVQGVEINIILFSRKDQFVKNNLPLLWFEYLNFQ